MEAVAEGVTLSDGATVARDRGEDGRVEVVFRDVEFRFASGPGWESLTLTVTDEDLRRVAWLLLDNDLPEHLDRELEGRPLRDCSREQLLEVIRGFWMDRDRWREKAPETEGSPAARLAAAVYDLDLSSEDLLAGEGDRVELYVDRRALERLLGAAERLGVRW